MIRTPLKRKGKLTCYWQTVKEVRTFLQILWEFGAIYIAHDYREMKPYRKGTRMYYPLKCRRCGDISEAWQELK